MGQHSDGRELCERRMSEPGAAEAYEAARLEFERDKALRDSEYLLRSPENGRRLMNSIDRLEAGHGEFHDLCE